MFKSASERKILKIILIIFILGVCYWATRLLNLKIIPIFTDEAIYLRWGQIAVADPRWRFISLIDGKQPLLIWLFLPVLKTFSDPLVAGRLVSIFCGFLSVIGLVLFGYVSTKSIRVAATTGFLYLIIPFFFVYDRLAIYDGLLTTISIWSLFFSYIFANRQKLDSALLLGTVIGAGLLTKSSANFFWYLLPLTLLLVSWEKNKFQKTFITWMFLSFVVVIQSQIYNAILRLSEFRHIIGQKNLSFIYSVAEILKNPFQGFWGNLSGLNSWLLAYMTVPLSIFILIGIIWYLHKDIRKGLFFLGYFLIPYLALALFGKVIYPRFLLFMLPPLLLITAEFIVFLSRKIPSGYFLCTGLLLFVPTAYFIYLLLFNPIAAPLPLADRQQLLNDWPSGYGIAEVVSYLDTESKNGPVVVGTEGTFGLFPMALELYLGKNVNVTFKAYWPLNEVPDELKQSAKKQPTFLLFKERQTIPQDWPIELIQAYQRGDGPTYLKFFQVKAE